MGFSWADSPLGWITGGITAATVGTVGAVGDLFSGNSVGDSYAQAYRLGSGNLDAFNADAAHNNAERPQGLYGPLGPVLALALAPITIAESTIAPAAFANAPPFGAGGPATFGGVTQALGEAAAQGAENLVKPLLLPAALGLGAFLVLSKAKK